MAPTSSSDGVGADRRRHPRVQMTRSAKVFLRSGLRFAAGQTTDLSMGGALLCIDSARPVKPGDVVDLMVVPKGAGGTVIEQESMRSARVVRVTPMNHYHQAVAVEFDQPMELAAVA